MHQEQKNFSSLLSSLSRSTTYSKFCQQVYGRDLSQFNSFDEEQLQFVLSKIRELRPRSILDLGCGTGRIAEFLAQNSDSQILGLDFADEMITSLKAQHFNQPRLDFVVGNLNALPDTLGNFDLILAIDTFYFVDFPGKMLSQLRNYLNPGGTVILFHSYQNKDQEAQSPLDPEQSPVGIGLLAAGYKFASHDFTENFGQIWEKALAVSHKLRAEFVDEGLAKTFESRVWESERNLEWYRSGRYRRSAYVATLS